ncbi:NAD-dependent epimerase/dehydratase family protein [Actinomyces naeslundii]|uniref:NADH(P)-binding protein, PF13460 family n=2 Tax=Actinomyces naeslundii TaxID=1655 RepID=J3ADE1_ACTNH|nr:NAD-dependent epimerase/dehydratase family protein [Actinomyces naeslundii]EJN86008.1 NADH(P)-binding protein, PF13460 family [Actinomyces naeslundii str. Howell 279]OMG30408.1 epimerase [Actinomyces naeslundii]OMG32030.1 epimerase [Actinomyces naeslundii]QQC19976.1 NAD(P)H-binding protein [Actinomyces naeslundii]
MASVLVAGATGYLGRYVVAELHNRGHLIRAVARDRDRARRQGPWGSPSLDGLVDEWALGNVTDPRFTRDLAADVEHVVSALGVTRQKADPWQIDNLANLAILDSALKHAGSFTYINALGGDRCPARLTRAKSAFAQTLSVAEINSQIINPPAYFSDMTEVLAMARRGLVTVLRPTARINPIHGADLAVYVVDRMEEGRTGTWDVGGPDVLSWRELAHLAFDAVGKRSHILTVPAWALPPALRLTGLFSPRLADTARFMAWNMTRDCVAPTTGTHHLADFYAVHAHESPQVF